MAFASFLISHFSFPALAQEFNFEKAKSDYVFNFDNYNQKLFDFNLKKDSYNKNSTLSLKEEFRISTYNFLLQRNRLISTYLTMLRMRVLEEMGLTDNQKSKIFEKIDQEVAWYKSRESNYNKEDILEDLINKSREEDSQYETNTDLVIKYALGFVGIGEVTEIKNNHHKLYQKLKSEALSIIELKRLNNSLFNRWFAEIDKELELLNKTIDNQTTKMDNVFSEDEFKREKVYEDVTKELDLAKTNMIKLNEFMYELETRVQEKR